MWKQTIPVILAAVVNFPNKALVFEILKLCLVGTVSGYATVKTLEYDVSNLKYSVAMINTAVAKVHEDLKTHEQQNIDRERQDIQNKDDDNRRWDARILRLESCFINRACGLK